MQKRYKLALVLIGTGWIAAGAHLLAYVMIPAWTRIVDSTASTFSEYVMHYSNSTVTFNVVGAAIMSLVALLLLLFVVKILRVQRKPHVAATLNSVTVTDDVLRQLWVAGTTHPYVAAAHADVVTTGRREEAWLLTVEVSARVGTPAYLEVEQHAQDVASEIQRQVGLAAPAIIRLHKSRTQQPSVL